jgi:hypothetical protein
MPPQRATRAVRKVPPPASPERAVPYPKEVIRNICGTINYGRERMVAQPGRRSWDEQHLLGLRAIRRTGAFLFDACGYRQDGVLLLAMQLAFAGFVLPDQARDAVEGLLICDLSGKGAVVRDPLVQLGAFLTHGSVPNPQKAGAQRTLGQPAPTSFR